jgi:hypothetical protein
MNADAGAPAGATTPISQPLQCSYPRSSPFIRGKILLPSAYPCLRRQPARPCPPAPQPSTPPARQLGPPRRIDDPRLPPQPCKSLRRNPYAQSIRRPERQTPRASDAQSIRRPEHQTPRASDAQSIRRSPNRCPSSPPSAAPRGRPTRVSPTPSRSACKMHPPAATPTPRETASARPPARQPARPANPYLPATTPYAQRARALPPPHLRALRALRGGSSFLPTQAPTPALRRNARRPENRAPHTTPAHDTRGVPPAHHATTPPSAIPVSPRTTNS